MPARAGSSPAPIGLRHRSAFGFDFGMVLPSRGESHFSGAKTQSRMTTGEAGRLLATFGAAVQVRFKPDHL